MSSKDVPSHIAIIPDGNRRFAKREGKLGYEGHSAGVEKFKEVLSWCKEKGIGEVTFWALSTENLKRETSELSALFKLMEKACDSIAGKKEKDFEGAKVRFIGNLEVLPENLRKKMVAVEAATKSEKRYVINILVAYGGRSELVQAVSAIATDVKSGKMKIEEITAESFSSKLYFVDEPDLIIRTGHACLSGFMPWQSAYSEIIFLDGKLWPEFSKKDFEVCLDEFAARKRNFGK
jgi:tritrans,polycis-undecaprenyl-diphosphate synthase [geranylgeranyl-diphosphate specific]